MKAKRKIIQAAHEQLSNLRQQKSTLLAKLANIEAKLRVLEATQTKNEFNFDDGSTLSCAKQTIADLEKRLNVMAHRAEIDGRYGDLDSPSSYVDPHRDVVKEVDEKFGESSAARRQGGGQEPLIDPQQSWQVWLSDQWLVTIECNSALLATSHSDVVGGEWLVVGGEWPVKGPRRFLDWLLAAGDRPLRRSQSPWSIRAVNQPCWDIGASSCGRRRKPRGRGGSRRPMPWRVGPT